MRVTQNSKFSPFQTSLQDIQMRLTKEQARLSSGQKIITLSDAPKEIVDVKRITDTIARNKQYQSNINQALKEITNVSETLDSMTNNFTKIRDLAIDATQSGNFGNLPVLALDIKGILDDILRDANSDFNGKLLFSGTKTTNASITVTPPATNNNPFELVQETPATGNPSGYKVIFKGDFNDREIYKDGNIKESINTKADEIFGTGGVKVFEDVVNLYNLLMYNKDGNKRGSGDTFTTSDLAKLNDYQKSIAKTIENLGEKNGKNGAQITRYEALSELLTSENTRLEEIRSQDADTDVTQSAMTLSRENTALQYSLQVGSKLVQQTLFDFIK